jgi:hypothetical protein
LTELNLLLKIIDIKGFFIYMFNIRVYLFEGGCAGIAQLVEYKLPKLGVASSNLVARSN